MYTVQAWATALLNKLGNTSPLSSTVEWVASWCLHETTPNTHGAMYNLLNTTEHNTPGVVSDFNSVGVVNFDTFEHGIEANAKVLQNGLYPNLLAALKTNKFIPENTLLYDNELETWGTGAVYFEIVTEEGKGLSDLFPGDILVWSQLDTETFQAVERADTSTGIATSWLAAQRAGFHYGPALCKEFQIGDFSYQYFAGGFCVWDHLKHLSSWSKYT